MQSFVAIGGRLMGFSKIMLPQKFNVCSCHLAKSLECIYRGGVGADPMPGQGWLATSPSGAPVAEKRAAHAAY